MMFKHPILLFVAATLSAFLWHVSSAKADEFPEVHNTQDDAPKLSTPEEALAEIRVPDGFDVSIFAAEPDVRQPIAMTFDARGRLWVAENYTYAERPLFIDESLQDRVVILEDIDRDGHCDKRTVFYDKAQQLTSVAVGFGGVWLMTPPQLLFIPDANGDDVPDSEPVVVLDGFYVGPGNRHNFANGLKWGPDGWLYGRHGITHVGNVGAPGTADDQRTLLGPGIWRYHPIRKTFETVCTGTTNPWGHDWDEHGELFFINTVIGHLWHAIPGAHFKRMFGADANPYVYELIDQFADHYHWDTKETWSDIRKGVTQTTDQAGGGHAHCGMMIYQGDNWPERYRGKLFTLNLHGRRINCDRLERAGASYAGLHEADEFFFGDQWFRGIELTYGPDGSVYVADWTDVGECHESDGVHRTSGRIFRIRYTGQTTVPDARSVPDSGIGAQRGVQARDLSSLSSADLVRYHLDLNEWYVRTARRLLQERAVHGEEMTTVHRQLRRLFDADPNVVHKLRALWTLYVTGGTSEQWLIEQLTHENEHVRAWAVRLLVDGDDVPRSTVDALTQMAPHEPSALVRLYLASSLQRLPQQWTWPLAINLGQWKDLADDRVFPLILWYGIVDAVPQNVDQALVMANTSRMPLIREFIARRVTQEMERQPDAFDKLLTVISRTTGKTRMLNLLTGVSEGLKGWRKAPQPARWADVQAKLANWPEPEARQIAQQIAVVFGDGRAMEELKQVAISENVDLATRRTALESLVAARMEGLQPLLTDLLADRDLSDAAVRGMATLNDPGVTETLIRRFGRMFPRGKEAAVEVLTLRPSSALELLFAVDAGTIDREYVTVFQVRQMQQYENERIQELLKKLWPQLRPITAEKKSRIVELKKLLTPVALAEADPSMGRAHFAKTCAKCHTLFGEGEKIGPDLTGSQRHNLDYLLENIVDPSAALVPNFRMTVIAMMDGRIISGVVLTRTEEAWEVQTPTEKLTLRTDEIDATKDSGISLMPEGLLDMLPPAEIANLFAYLQSKQQVPLPDGR